MKVRNPDGVRNFLDGVGRALGESTIRRAAVAGARVVLAEAKARAPVGPAPHHQGTKQFPVGYGRDALLIAYLPEHSADGRVATYGVTWAADAYYLRYIEYGTSTMAARPFFRPAIEATRQAQADAVRAVLDQSMSGVSRG